MFSRQISRILKLQNKNALFPRMFASTEQEPSRIEKTINNVTLLGRAGGEAQKKGSDDHPVVIFSLATHSNYRYDTGDFMQRVEWHRICVFKPALREAVLTYLKKGQRVYVTGKLSYGEVKNDDGTQKYTTAIIADDVIFFQNPEIKK